MPYIYIVNHRYDKNKKKVVVEKNRLFIVKDVPFEAIEMYLEEKLKEKYGHLLQEKRRKNEVK